MLSIDRTEFIKDNFSHQILEQSESVFDIDRTTRIAIQNAIKYS